jgi:lysophospholipase L1-like esterase
MAPARPASIAVVLSFVVGCGGGGSPTAPTPQPTPTPGSTVAVVVFHDDDGDGALGADEGSRIPEVEVSVGGRSARTEVGSGRAVVSGVASGAQTVSVNAATLPPFFVAGAPVTIQVPTAADVPFPVTLPIGSNRPRVYMAYGDSITSGNGSTDGMGYRGLLQSMLASQFGGAGVIDQSRDGNISDRGARLLDEALLRHRPAYTLILFGTNDWNLPTCRDVVPCETVDNVRKMVQNVKDRQSLPIVGTIPPANPALVAPDRNEWVAGIDELIRDVAREEGAPVADIQAAFLQHGDLPSLYSDHVHPNDAGYQIVAEAFFEAIAHRR